MISSLFLPFIFTPMLSHNQGIINNVRLIPLYIFQNIVFPLIRKTEREEKGQNVHKNIYNFVSIFSYYIQYTLAGFSFSIG